MCCAFIDPNGDLLRPGKAVAATGAAGDQHRLPWVGFARSEILAWWQRQGAQLVDIAAARFAERAEDTREMIWDDLPAGRVIRGLIDRRGPRPLLKIVTRASTPAELARFRHPRMPLVEPPLAPVPS